MADEVPGPPDRRPESEIPATALPNDRSPAELHLRPAPDGSIVVDPELAGWRYLGFAARRLIAGEPLVVGGEGVETLVVPIAGGGLRATVRGGTAATLEIAGRRDPFSALPSAFYLPPGTAALLEARPLDPGRPVEIAIATAPGYPGRQRTAEAVTIVPRDVRVEIRGRGNATRQINHILPPEFPADRLLAVEVLTPGGNWSSWPPHKHDRDRMPEEAVLEEIYHYRFRRPDAWGLQRLYRPDRSRDALWEVRSGDVVLVTDGYHPFVAAHGDDAWYFNALAGDRRTMACAFDPDLDWVRTAWETMAPDPRLPLVAPPA
jgi:5-deoxy-glucuronate isomerase